RADRAGPFARSGQLEEHGPGQYVDVARGSGGGEKRDHGRVKTSGPDSVTAMVCSKWAEYLPSRVTTVQPSPSVRVSCVPMLIIGSTASTSPARRRGFGCPRPQRAGP